jgi:16S rRNA processing protein RimM
MKNAETSYVTVGKIGSSFGVHGWIKVQTYTEFGPKLLEYQPWYLSQGPDQWLAVTIEEGQIHGRGLIVKFPGIDTPEAARLMTGKTIAVTRDQLPSLDKNEFYWSDLIGMTVINSDGSEIGKVIYLMETGSNDVLVVKGTKEHAIPYLPDSVIKSIDMDKREIHVDWELL